MKVETANGVYEAFPLIMRREYAKQILNRKKRVELRECSNRYGAMFFTDEYWSFIRRGMPEREKRRYENGDNMFKEDVKMVHFYNYQNTLCLDCSIQGLEIIKMTKEEIDWLCEEYNIPDDDVIHEEWKAYEGTPKERVPVMFAIVMGSVEKQKGYDGEYLYYLSAGNREERGMMNER
jgi:hypothetical protein